MFDLDTIPSNGIIYLVLSNQCSYLFEQRDRNKTLYWSLGMFIHQS